MPFVIYIYNTPRQPLTPPLNHLLTTLSPLNHLLATLSPSPPLANSSHHPLTTSSPISQPSPPLANLSHHPLTTSSPLFHPLTTSSPLSQSSPPLANLSHHPLTTSSPISQSSPPLANPSHHPLTTSLPLFHPTSHHHSFAPTTPLHPLTPLSHRRMSGASYVTGSTNELRLSGTAEELRFEETEQVPVTSTRSPRRLSDLGFFKEVSVKVRIQST